MDYKHKLARLEDLKTLVDKYNPIKYSGTVDKILLNRKICETYGEVEDIYSEIIGNQNVSVPGRSGKSQYPNYFEAGFLSGRTIHSHQGISELLKVIGRVKTLASKIKESDEINNIISNRVFLVHGQDDLAKTECARFIEQLGYEPIILHEQPSSGKTIIEKIEEFSNVGFGIVLYTPCDIGAKSSSSAPDLQPRARQNVVFEHGFLNGKLGRHNVCALVKGKLETPNDISGIVYIPMDDNGAWKIDLAKEMRNSGYDFDMNKVI
jgi:predicted nucleotide-binding protein